MNLAIIIIKFMPNLAISPNFPTFVGQLLKQKQMIERIIAHNIPSAFNLGKIAVVLGARQVGKTTLLDILAPVSATNTLRLNCDDAHDVAMLVQRGPAELRAMLGEYDYVVIDEAQRVPDIGLTLKKIGDLKLPARVVVTGSSSLDLASGISEPATGRVFEYHLYPFSLAELANATSSHEEEKMLQRRLIYGLYPEVVTAPAMSKELLMNLTNDYLYKDLLALGGIRKPQLLQNLVRALALQIGSEVSYNELAQLLGADKLTIENYINLLEKCFVVFKIDSFSRNLRNEIKKSKKIYFYDNGVRNAVLSNFAPLELRDDVGALWENMMMSERLKRNSYARNYAHMYFWRTHSQSEIDLVEEVDGQLSAYEFKWNSRHKPAKLPAQFQAAYGSVPITTVTPSNFWEFVG